MFENLRKSFTVKLILGIIVLWIILAFIFGFTDLEISIAVVDENSNWGNFGADYGEPPGNALIALALTIFLGGFFKKLHFQKIPAYISVLVGILFIVFSNDITDIITGLGLIVPIMICVIFTWKKDWSAYRTLSGVISLLAIIFPLVFVQLIKVFWGRVRFRDLSPGFIEYTPWFIPQGITGNYSFPSGHSAMGWMFLPLLIPLWTKQWKSPIRIIGTIVIIGWGIFVGLSRIAIGAHYASDVLFSTGIAILITFLLHQKYYSE
ncbi:MAG: phosphatase PAP2 family protein [Candidatus Lokiarchaeota archaeon]|nr:phosphatase PAP2 family protein [Candidatus Lokiarchaeota archaeon]